jgi:hypothetical protein
MLAAARHASPGVAWLQVAPACSAAHRRSLLHGSVQTPHEQVYVAGQLPAQLDKKCVSLPERGSLTGVQVQSSRRSTKVQRWFAGPPVRVARE